MERTRNMKYELGLYDGTRVAAGIPYRLWWIYGELGTLVKIVIFAVP